MRKLLILALCLGVLFGTGAPSVAKGPGHSGGGYHGGGSGHHRGWGGSHGGGGGHHGGWRGYRGGWGWYGSGWQAPYIVNSALNAGLGAYSIYEGCPPYYYGSYYYPRYCAPYYTPYYPAYSPYYAPGYYSCPAGWPGSVGTVYDGYGY